MNINEYSILLIDDDEDDFVILKSLCAEIPGSKYVLTWKSNYKEGLEAILSKKYDICLLDHRLGEQTGIELLAEIQKNEQVCPTILLTGQGDVELDIQAMQMGAAEFLVKGQLTAPLLERTIRYAMKHSWDMQELRESRAQILQQDRLASLGLLASSLAHEIGTPLGIIRSRAELAERRASSNEALKQDMNTITTQIDRITKLVNSLLNLAREKKSEHGGLVNLNQVIQDVLSLMRPEFERKGIVVNLSVPENVQVRAESGPLGQVLLNLLVNSLHAIVDENKYEKKKNHQLTVKVENLADTVEIAVQDTGCGISEKNLSQLFKPFFTTKDVGHGTGLGLATSYKLVQSWKGSISVESQEGLGSTFTVKLLKS